MNTDTEQTTSGGMRWPQVLLIVLVTILLTIGGTWWALKTYLFASEFKPVELSVKEEQVLQTKLRALGYQTGGRSMGQEREPVGELNEEGFLKPEPYSEVGAKREVSFNERELNALLAKNTDLAKKLAIDLSDDLVSARLLVPMDADFPVLGGKTLRFNAGVEMAYLQGKPVIVLKGVSIMGVPIPNAWLGGLKNIDLVSEFGNRDGFWKSFSEGVDNIRVENGKITVKLKE
ncbi:MAG TPA: arginine N-succinyltransferase [Gammaproteobacteria bacterium]|nr:arginine N-succinyltransferase [Gammaproteobacteria bacterium]